jgi:phytoene dehydrogenase-like protein
VDENYDFVVIGSGHNGLIAAAYLAKAGLKALILEANADFGGGVVTSDQIAPGFRHDMHSNSHQVIMANPLILNDELGLQSEYGLNYIRPEVQYSTIFNDQTSIVTYTDLDRSCESIAKISPRDADAYRRFTEMSLGILPLLTSGLFVPPMPQGPFWALLDQSSEGRLLMRYLQYSVLDVVKEWFENEKVIIHLLKLASEAMTSPEVKGTGLVVFTMPAFVHTYPGGLPEGGSGVLVDALIRCLEAHGADLRANSTVTKILVEGGTAVGVRLQDGEEIRAKRAVIGQIHPLLLERYFDDLDETVAGNAGRVQMAAFAIMAMHFALKEPPKYHAGGDGGQALLAGFAPSRLNEFRRIFDDFRYGTVASDPFATAMVHSQHDSSRAPAGQAALTLFGFGPFDLDGDSANWDHRKEEMGNWLRHGYGSYVTNLTDDNIIAECFHTPLDVQRRSPSFQRGDVTGVGKYFHQIGGHRPTPELAQYTVPGIDKFYLAGTFMHPPGGVTGGGRATAIKICEELSIDFDSLTE